MVLCDCICPTIFIVSLVSGWLLFAIYRKFFQPLPVPQLDTDQYWGPGSAADAKADQSINEFKVNIAQDEIAKLAEKLSDTAHLPEPLEGVAFEYGFNSNKLKQIVKYWKDDYLPRWRSREEFLNKFPQFTTSVNGLKIHYIHAKPNEAEVAKANKEVIPLLILHGWPGSVREFYDIIPKLITPNDNCKYVFEVIAPSLPGYGWSQGASKKGFGPTQKAIVLRNLMVQIGFSKFFVQGGDWGSIIGNRLTTLFPENVLGYHSNMCIVITPQSLMKMAIASLFPSLFVAKEYVHFHFPLLPRLAFLWAESGYFHIQGTKPDTVGIAVGASPIGLAAYILEKFSTGVDLANLRLADGGLDKTFNMDALLDNVMLYYLSKCFTTSARFYCEAGRGAEKKLQMDRVPTPVPTGCIRFKHDLHAPLEWQLADKYTNLVHSSYYENGGHFAALEVPDVLYNDFVEFVNKVK